MLDGGNWISIKNFGIGFLLNTMKLGKKLFQMDILLLYFDVFIKIFESNNETNNIGKRKETKNDLKLKEMKIYSEETKAIENLIIC